MHRASTHLRLDRYLITILCLLSIVVFPLRGSTTNGQILWHWAVPGGTKFAGYRAYDLGIDHNRFAGVRRWGNEHILVYAVGGQTSLAIRNADNSTVYVLRIYILNAQSGALETSMDLPVESALTELQVVKGGIVVRSGHRLTFLSKQLKRVGPGFTVPLLLASQAWGIEGEIGDWSKLFVSLDGEKFVVSCEHGRLEKYYLFDGDSFALISTITMNEPIRAESFGDQTLLFRASDDTTSVRAAHFGQRDTQESALIYSGKKKACVVAVYMTRREFANVCGGVSIVDIAGRETVIETAPRGEVQVGKGALSEDRNHLALARRIVKSGSSFLDISPRVAGFVVKVFRLDSSGSVVQLPITPTPKEICDYIFVGDNTLVVMNDDQITAYNLFSEYDH